jgi:hypothetical protein
MSICLFCADDVLLKIKITNELGKTFILIGKRPLTLEALLAASGGLIFDRKILSARNGVLYILNSEISKSNFSRILLKNNDEIFIVRSEDAIEVLKRQYKSIVTGTEAFHELMAEDKLFISP